MCTAPLLDEPANYAIGNTAKGGPRFLYCTDDDSGRLRVHVGGASMLHGIYLICVP